jgi:hypothetical protein
MLPVMEQPDKSGLAAGAAGAEDLGRAGTCSRGCKPELEAVAWVSAPSDAPNEASRSTSETDSPTDT